jgi:hypothetical protein
MGLDAKELAELVRKTMQSLALIDDSDWTPQDSICFSCAEALLKAAALVEGYEIGFQQIRDVLEARGFRSDVGWGDPLAASVQSALDRQKGEIEQLKAERQS